MPRAPAGPDTGGAASGGAASGGAASGGAASGGAASGGETADRLSYARDIQPIWDQYCIQCHGIQPPDLAAPNSRTRLAGTSRFPECDQAPFLVAGEPEKSFLYFKLTRISSVAHDDACKRWMPAEWNGAADTPLIEIDAAAIEQVRKWIEQGASTE